MADLPGGHGGGRGTGRGDLDAWLAEPVRPLEPPPGAFEQVRRRARRRKLRQAAWSAAAAALLAAAAVTVPRLVIPQLSPGRPIAANLPHHGTTPNPSRPASAPAGSAGPPNPLSTATAPVSTHPMAPPNFQPTSVTFVSPSTGWVIGQAGHPGHCGPPNAGICTSIARTDDAGGSWYGVAAPVTGPPDGASGVGQIRFLDGIDGWAFGPELWATHDAGQHWRQIPTHGMRVTTLETSDGRAFAVWARCDATARAAASGCTGFTLYSAAADTNRWQPVPGAAGLTAGGAPASAALVLTGATVYLLTPTGQLLTGPVTGTGMHPVAGGAPAPCRQGTPRPGGRQAGELLAAVGSPGTGLALLCPGAGAGSVQEKNLYYSADSGASWRLAGSAPPAGIATSLAGTPGGRVVLATTRGIEVAAGPGAPWHAAGPALPGGFTYVGMTTDWQGVAVPADPLLHAVWFSHDGGQSWQKSPIP